MIQKICWLPFDAYFMTFINEKADYTDKHHRLKWLNTIIGNIQTRDHWRISWSIQERFSTICHRYNHRKTGMNILNKIAKYLYSSSQMPRKAIVSGNGLFHGIMCQMITLFYSNYYWENHT